MRLLFASITYGPTDPEANRSHRGAIMAAANAGHKWVGDVSPDHMKFDDARNTVAQEALELQDEADAVMWVDSDIVLPVYAIARMASYNMDFVTGIYFQKSPPYWPLIAQLNKEQTGFHWYMGWPPDTLAPIDGCGFGCCLTSMKMLKDLGDPPWFHFKQFSEDFTLCLKAKAAGYNLMVDTGVICGHLTTRRVGFEDFKNAHPKFYTAEGGNGNGSIRSGNESRDAVLSGDGSSGRSWESYFQENGV